MNRYQHYLQQGMDAASAGKSLSDCPYASQTDEFRAWTLGYRKSKSQAVRIRTRS